MVDWCAQQGLGGSDQKQTWQQKVKKAQRGLGQADIHNRVPEDLSNRAYRIVCQACVDLGIPRELAPAIYVGEYYEPGGANGEVRSLVFEADFIASLNDREFAALAKHEIRHLSHSFLMRNVAELFMLSTFSVRNYAASCIAGFAVEMARGPNHFPSEAFNALVHDIRSSGYFTTPVWTAIVAIAASFSLLKNMEAHLNEYDADRAELIGGDLESCTNMLRKASDHGVKEWQKLIKEGEISFLNRTYSQLIDWLYGKSSIVKDHPNFAERIAAQRSVLDPEHVR